ncbi:MAG: hypothetical protein V4438_00345 [Patescibacteria group bacterium]
MKICKFLFSFLFVFGSLFALSSTASAADAPNLSSEASSDHIPQVYVKDVSIGDAVSYKAGSTIKGTITLANFSDFDASEIQYEIILVGGFGSNGLPSENYGSITGDASVFLKSKQEKTFDFSYTLPAGLGGESFGLFVRTKLPSGYHLGELFSHHFALTGGSTMLSVLYSSVDTSALDGSSYNSYSLHTGPTIYRDNVPSKAMVRFTLHNTTKNSVTVTPTLDVYLRDVSGRNVYHKVLVGNAISVAAGKDSGDVTIDLPNFEYTPGVYVGVLSFRDADGIERASKIDFRYIVGGDIYTIQSLSSDKSAASQGSTVLLTMGYSGTPQDLYSSSSPRESSQSADVTVSLWNEENLKVGEITESIDFMKSNVHQFQIPLTGDARALRAEVSVSVGGKVVASNNFNLSPEYSGAAELADPIMVILPYILWTTIILVLILILIWIIRKGMHRNIGVLVAFLILLLGALSAYLLTSRSQAFSIMQGRPYTYYTVAGYLPPNVFLSTPTPSKVVPGGSKISVTGHVSYYGCTNSPNQVVMSVWNYDGSEKQSTLTRYVPASCGTNHRLSCYRNNSFDDLFAFTITAPTTPGTYKLYVQANKNNGTEMMTGYEEYIVQGGDTTTTSGSGCSAGQYYCELLKKCILTSASCNTANPDYVPTVINPNIPAAEGPVKLKALGANPPVGNTGYTCKISWDQSFASYDKDTHCTFTGGGTSITFDPSTITAPTFFDSGSLTKDTNYKMSCHEGTNGFAETSEATCRLNWNYKEVN